MGAIYRNGIKYTVSPNNSEMINYGNTTVKAELDSLNSKINNEINHTKVAKKLGKWIDGVHDVYVFEFNFAITANTPSSYTFGALVPSTVPHNQVWVESGFLQTANGTLPINMTDGSSYIITWVENGRLQTKSNTFSGTAYARVMYYM